MVAPIKGVWDIIVDGDDITVVKAFIFKRHWKFSDISYGKVTRGGMKIYVEGGKKKAFFVDGMCEHFSNFMKRMEKEGKISYILKECNCIQMEKPCTMAMMSRYDFSN